MAESFDPYPDQYVIWLCSPDPYRHQWDSGFGLPDETSAQSRGRQ